MSDRIVAAQKKLTDRVMGRAGVTGTAIGQKGGSPCLVVYTDGEVAGGVVPKTVEGFPVVVEHTGTFRKL